VTAVRVPVALVATPPSRAERQADLDQAAVHPANQIQINSKGEPVSAGPVGRPATAESRHVSAVHPANQIQVNSRREPVSAGSPARPATAESEVVPAVHPASADRAESRRVPTVHPANQIQINSPPRPPPAEVEPLTADLSRVHMTVPRSYHEKLAALRSALAHSHPGASAAELIEAAF
jgi:hypothetical protein